MFVGSLSAGGAAVPAGGLQGAPTSESEGGAGLGVRGTAGSHKCLLALSRQGMLPWLQAVSKEHQGSLRGVVVTPAKVISLLLLLYSRYKS